MSDNYTEPQDDDDESNEPDGIKALRLKAKKADQYERENAALQRKIAFIEAGIPTSDPRVSYFVKGYDGDLNAESIRNAAIEAGFLEAQQDQPDPQVEQAKQGQQRVQQASAGVQPSFDEDAVAYGMQQALAEGGLEAMAEYAEQFGITFNSPTL